MMNKDKPLEVSTFQEKYGESLNTEHLQPKDVRRLYTQPRIHRLGVMDIAGGATSRVLETTGGLLTAS